MMQNKALFIPLSFFFFDSGGATSREKDAPQKHTLLAAMRF